MYNCHRCLQAVLALFLTANAFGLSVKPTSPQKNFAKDIRSTPTTTTRIGFIKQLACIPLVAGAVAAPVSPANASGGATAGGAYLLSAKQRYNERVKGSVQGLLAAGESLAAEDSKPAKAYFSSEEAGSWKDLTAAGYLLSNAFRRSSTTPPDKLPAVQKYKAFAAEVDNLQKVLKKKGAAAASGEFPKVEAALDTWLNEIELPNAKEL